MQRKYTREPNTVYLSISFMVLKRKCLEQILQYQPCWRDYLIWREMLKFVMS